MEKKITIPDLAQTLAEQKKISHKEAEEFVRIFFDTISQQVVADGVVKIKGLGTFKMVDVLNRESVDVNTGERIVIPGHNKVSFTPEAALKDLINKPFADFQTVIINEGTNIEDMERIDTPQQIVEEPAEPIVEEPVAPVAEKVVEPVHEQPAEPQVEEVVEAVAEPVIAEETITDTTEEVPVEEPADEKVVEQPTVVEQKEETPTQQSVAEEPTVQQVINEIKQERKTCSMMCKLLFGLIVLILMVLSYLAGYNKLFDKVIDAVKTSQKTEQPVVVHKQQDPVKPVAEPKKSKQVAPVDSSQFYTQVPNSKYLIVGHLKDHKLERGEFLLKLARQEYHDEDAYACIVAFNNFANPSSIHIGTIIKMPKLKLKEEQTETKK